MNKQIDRILGETNWALEMELPGEITKEDENYINNYFANITDEDLCELLFFSKVRDVNWIEGLMSFICYEVKFDHIDFDKFMSELLDSLFNSILRDREPFIIESFYNATIYYFNQKTNDSKKFWVDFIHIAFSFLSTKQNESVSYTLNQLLVNSSFMVNYLEYYLINNLTYITYDKVNLLTPIFVNKQKKLKTRDETTNIFIMKNKKHIKKIELNDNEKNNIKNEYIFNDTKNFFFYFSDGTRFVNSYCLNKTLRVSENYYINSNVIPENVEKLYANNFYNRHLVELYNLSNIELDFDREDLKKYYFIKPMIIHKSLAEKSVITKHNNFVFAYINNKGYLIGYKGNDKEVTLPSSFKYEKIKVKEYEIREYTCDYQTNIERLVIPKNITKLGINIFFNQVNLKELILDCNLVEVIPTFAFACCGKLERIYLPRSIKKIEEFAFASCISLKDIYYEGSEEEYKKIEIIKSKSIYNKDEFGKAKVHYNCKIKDIK